MNELVENRVKAALSVLENDAEAFAVLVARFDLVLGTGGITNGSRHIQTDGTIHMEIRPEGWTEPPPTLASSPPLPVLDESPEKTAYVEGWNDRKNNNAPQYASLDEVPC